MKQTDLTRIQELKRLIRLELESCDAAHWPVICRLKARPEGYRYLEDLLIHYAIKEGMPIGAGLALLEQEVSHHTELI